MSDGLHPLLLDAKKEYVTRLTELMTPIIVSHFDQFYGAACEENRRKAVVGFQKQLLEIPGWNSMIVKQYTAEIEQRYGFLSQLIAAVFVTHVKVLSSIRLSNEKPTIQLRIPSDDAFVHRVYMFAAKSVYENPVAFVQGSRSSKACLVGPSIEQAVRDLIPMGDVLSAYLASAVDNEKKTVNPILSPANSDDEDEPVPMPEDQSRSPSESDEDETKVVHYDDAPAQTSLDTAEIPSSASSVPQFPSVPQPQQFFPVAQPQLQPQPQQPLMQSFEPNPSTPGGPGGPAGPVGPAGPGGPHAPRPVISDAHDGDSMFR